MSDLDNITQAAVNTPRKAHLPDLLSGDVVCANPHGCTVLVSVEATSNRGRAFLTAFYEAIDQDAGGAFSGDDIEFLTLLPKRFDQLKRHARIAALSMGELKDYRRSRN